MPTDPAPGSYPVPAARHRAELVIERSRFRCTLDRVDTAAAAAELLAALRAEMPDATHHCWAFVAGLPGSTSQVGMSDAGEPHGTAGRPMLTVLLHSGVGDVAAIVTRYYGGIKLGTGGLVKAYSGAVQHALDSLPRTLKVDHVGAEVVFGHAQVTVVRQLLAGAGVAIEAEVYGADVRYRLAVPRNVLDDVRRSVADATRGTARWIEDSAG